MKSLIPCCFALFCVTSYAGIDYPSKQACMADIDQRIEETDNLPPEISNGYWMWFESFRRSESQIRTSCEGSQCTANIRVGGCDAVENPSLFALMKPQLEEELLRMQSKQPSLKEAKRAIVCRHPSSGKPNFDNCQLQ